MRGQFKYYYVSQSYGSLDIEDIGNCAIEACDDRGVYKYLVIKTNLGETKVFTYGPTIPDIPIPAKSVNISFKRISYNEAKIGGIIEKFLQDPYMSITQANEVTAEEALSNCMDLIEYMKLEDI